MLVRIANREDPDQTASSEEDKGGFFWGEEGFKMFQVVLLVIMCPNLGNVSV